MKTICAWCEHEGKTVVVEERASGHGRVEYGICPPHVAKLVTRLHKFYPPQRATASERAAA